MMRFYEYYNMSFLEKIMTINDELKKDSRIYVTDSLYDLLENCYDAVNRGNFSNINIILESPIWISSKKIEYNVDVFKRKNIFFPNEEIKYEYGLIDISNYDIEEKRKIGISKDLDGEFAGRLMSEVIYLERSRFSLSVGQKFPMLIDYDDNDISGRKRKKIKEKKEARDYNEILGQLPAYGFSLNV